MNIRGFMDKYVYSSIKLFCVFIFLNIFFFIILAFVSSRGERTNPTQLLEQISNELSVGNPFGLSEKMRTILNQQKIWCMLISNKDGSVTWSYQLPAELPLQYSYGDIAEMSKWYLEDYPVFVANKSNGLLVIGCAQDTYWKITTYKTVSSIEIEIIGFITVFFLNIFIVMFLFVFNRKKIERSKNPILAGIENIASGKSSQLVEEGQFADINIKLNRVANTLQRRDVARANWISGISHDIRTPLSVVLGYSSSLEENNKLNKEDQERIITIRQQAEKIKKLIEDLNLTSRLEYDMQPLQITKVYLVEMARQVVCGFLDNGIEDKYSIDFFSDTQSEMESIKGDEALLCRAFTNLIQNSITHNTAGCKIIIKFSNNGENVVAVVSDNGVGVNSEKLQKFYAMSHHMKNIDANGNVRHGLGLVLVQQIVEAHGGTIQIDSKAHNGFKTVLTFKKSIL